MTIFPYHLYTVPFHGKVGYCANGSRHWFRSKGLDWSDFVANGIDSRILIATGDPLALALVSHVEKQGSENGRQE